MEQQVWNPAAHIRTPVARPHLDRDRGSDRSAVRNLYDTKARLGKACDGSRQRHPDSPQPGSVRVSDFAAPSRRNRSQHGDCRAGFVFAAPHHSGHIHRHIRRGSRCTRGRTWYGPHRPPAALARRAAARIARDLFRDSRGRCNRRRCGDNSGGNRSGRPGDVHFPGCLDDR